MLPNMLAQYFVIQNLFLYKIYRIHIKFETHVQFAKPKVIRYIKTFLAHTIIQKSSPQINLCYAPITPTPFVINYSPYVVGYSIVS